MRIPRGPRVESGAPRRGRVLSRCAATSGALGLLVGVSVGCSPDHAADGSTPTSAAASSAVAPLTPAVLLSAAQMPAWNGAMGWAERELPPGTGALTVCRLPSADSLGAIHVLTRDFVATGDADPGTTPDPSWPPSHATNAVALFRDGPTAQAAVSAWEVATRECAPGPRVSGEPDSRQIGDLPTGSTWAVAARDTSGACPECLRFDFLGFAAKGAAVTTVGFSLTGLDANYEGDPLAESMDASLALLP